MKKIKFPLVTIITPAYNRADLIDKTIDSILHQDYPRIEYIILDDGSKDNTLSVLKKYKKKYGDRLTVIAQRNMGETRTVNKGFGMAHGEYVAVVNSDDPLLPGAVSAIVGYLAQHPGVLVAYPDVKIIGGSGEHLDTGLVHDYDYGYMLRNQYCIIGPAAFIKTDAIKKYGGRDPSYQYVADFEFWLRLGQYGQGVRIPQVLATFRIHAGSQSEYAKGDAMADEHIRLIHHTYALPHLPAAAQQVRNVAFASAYFHAAYLYASRWKMLKAYAISFGYHPPTFLRKFRAVLAKIKPLRQAYQQLKKFYYDGLRLLGIKRKPFVIKGKYSLSYYVSPDSSLDAQLLHHGIYADWIATRLGQLIRDDSIVFDIGANAGLLSLPFARAHVPHGCVYAFEPNPQSLEQLRANVKFNHLANVEIVPMALQDGPHKKTVTLYQREARDGEGLINQGLSSVHDIGLHKVGQIVVRAWTIDQCVKEHKIPRLDFIKIDVEGAEIYVLRGGEKAIRRFRPIIMYEYSTVLDQLSHTDNSRQSFKFLQYLGYVQYLIVDEKRLKPFKKYDQTLTNINVLAFPKDAVPAHIKQYL